MDLYATHIPVLEAVFDRIEIKKVFEVGMGLYSTPFFCQRAEEVISVEQQSEEWFEKVSNECNLKNWKSYCLLGPEGGIEILKDIDVDFGFVDGHERGRFVAINLMLRKRIPTVVIHDTGLIDYYLLRRVEIPYGYNQYHYKHKDKHPRTSIITQHDLADMIVRDHSPILFGM